jgi:hypothetical protein
LRKRSLIEKIGALYNTVPQFLHCSKDKHYIGTGILEAPLHPTVQYGIGGKRGVRREKLRKTRENMSQKEKMPSYKTENLRQNECVRAKLSAYSKQG